jgi:ribosomal protein S18 acetylase RimI-like enzyme
MGKAEGRGEEWHGHVTCLTVAPEYRRLGLADDMMNQLERVSEHMYAFNLLVDIRTMRCAFQPHGTACKSSVHHIEWPSSASIG